MLYRQNGESQFKFARNEAAFDVLVEIIGATLHMETVREDEVHLLMTVDQNDLTNCEFLDQPELDKLTIREYQSSGFFVPVSRSEVIILLVCPALHLYVHYPMVERRTCRAPLLKMNENLIF